MPTARPRHMITETDEISEALDDAARRWPGDRHERKRLLVRLIEEGHQALRDLGVRSVALHDDAYLGLAELRAMTNLRLPDCCVLLAAEREEAALATFDGRLGAVADRRGVTVLGLS